MSKKLSIFKIGSLVIVCGVVVAAMVAPVEAAEKIVKEMVIQVQSKVIALPGNKAMKVPISAARIRSTELRTLNEQYNAISIEKIFELNSEKSSSGLEIKGVKDTDKLLTKTVEGAVDLSKIFTQEVKKEMEKQKKPVIELENVFLIQFEFEQDAPMTGLLDAYKALTVVSYVEQIVRK